MFIQTLINEFKSTFKVLLPINIATLVAAAAGRLLLALAGSEPSTIMISVIKFVQFAVIAITVIDVIAPFVMAYNRAYYDKEPDDSSSLRTKLVSKTVCSFVWIAFSVVVATFSYAIFFSSYPFYVALIFDGNALLETITILLLVFIGLLILSQEYLSVSIGKMFKNNQLLFSIISLAAELAVSCSLYYVLFFADFSEKIFSFIPEPVYSVVSGYGILFAILTIAMIILCFEISVKLINKCTAKQSEADEIQ